MGYQDEDELSEEGFLEMLADYEKLSKLQEQYRELPHSPQRVELCLEAVAVADRLEEPSEQLAGRFDLAYAYIFGDDPAKALPVCAEFMQLHQENPGELGEAEGDAVISVAMLASSIARRLPQIPLEQCKSLLAEFQDQVRAYGLGERLWQCHAGEFAMMTGDLTALEEHLDRFRAAERDDVSDCAVCETGAMAEYLLTLGRRTEAVALVEELLEKQEFCEEQPWKLLSIITDDALERNDLQAAERFSAAMVLQPIKNPTDLRRVGTLLRMKGASGDWKNGLKLLKKSLPWTANFWDQELLFYFYLGAASFCQAYSAEHTEIKLPPVPGFTDCPENGVYDCVALTQWFWSRAEEIGARFDRRNGCPNYRERLKRLMNDPLKKAESKMGEIEQEQEEPLEEALGESGQSRKGSFAGFVLLSEGEWDKQQFIRDMKEKWNIAVVEDADQRDDAVVFEVDDMIAAVSLMPAPIPNGEAEANAENNYLWKDAVKVAKEHRAHLMVAVLGKEENILEKGMFYTKLAAACCRQKYAVGVYTSGVVFEPRFYESFADMMQEGELPIFNWVWFGLYRSKGGLNAYTYGMDVFGKDEMEVLNADAEPDDLRNFLASLTGFVLENNIELQDGKTIGFTAEDKHTITRSPGVSLPEEQMTLKISWNPLDDGGEDDSDGENPKDEGQNEPEVYTEDEVEAVEDHIERCFGQVETVLHELVSPDIHVDIYVVAPSEERNYYTLLTMGMGAHRMNVPKELAEYKLERAELAIALPADWRLNQESIQDERWYWPIRLLKALARLPIVNDTWLAWGHTMDNTRPFAENTELCAFILAGAQSPVEGCQVCTLPDGDEINFYQVLPLYRNELEYKLQHDADALLDRMADISFVVRTDRRNIIR